MSEDATESKLTVTERKTWWSISHDKRDEYHKSIANAIHDNPSASDRKIARLFGCCHKSVSRVRKRFFNSKSIYAAQIDTIKERVVQILRDDRNKSNEEIRRLTGANIRTIMRSRKNHNLEKVTIQSVGVEVLPRRIPSEYLKKFESAHSEASEVRSYLIGRLDESFESGPLGNLLKRLRPGLKKIGHTPASLANAMTYAMFPQEFFEKDENVALAKLNRSYKTPSIAGVMPDTTRGTKRCKPLLEAMRKYDAKTRDK